MLLKLLYRWMMEITKMISQVQAGKKYIKLELNFIEIMARQQHTRENKFILFEKFFKQDISIQTLCRRDDYDSREKWHSQYKFWHPGEREKAKNSPAIERGHIASWKMQFDEVYNKISWVTHEQESMNFFNLGSLMQEHSSKLIRPMSLIPHLLKGVDSLNHFVYFPKLS